MRITIYLISAYSLSRSRFEALARGLVVATDGLGREIAAAGLRDVEVIRTSCLFPCNAGPVAILCPRGRWHLLTSRAEVGRFVGTAPVRGARCPELETFTTGDPA